MSRCDVRRRAPLGLKVTPCTPTRFSLVGPSPLSFTPPERRYLPRLGRLEGCVHQRLPVSVGTPARKRPPLLGRQWVPSFPCRPPSRLRPPQVRVGVPPSSAGWDGGSHLCDFCCPSVRQGEGGVGSQSVRRLVPEVTPRLPLVNGDWTGACELSVR